MSAPRNLVGQRFGRLLVIAGGGSLNERRLWLCRCDCGTECSARTDILTRDRAAKRSCGCLRRETMARIGSKNGTHRLSRTAEYRSWARMIHRCHNSKDNRFEYYGGRGIVVCRRWRESFEAFLADMGAKPGPRYTIDRYPDRDGDYEPSNCRWATYTEQNRNRRPFKQQTLSQGA